VERPVKWPTTFECCVRFSSLPAAAFGQAAVARWVKTQRPEAAGRGRTVLTQRGPSAAMLDRRGAGVVGATRRDGVVRRVATLMFADRWTRSSVMRRTAPRTVDGVARGHGQGAYGGLSCHGDIHPDASRVVLPVCQAVISAQTNPASSRAMAVTTTFLLALRASSRRNRAHRRCWAAQDRAMVSGSA
jgi:hypothetical protein